MAKSSYLCFHKGEHYYAIENSEILYILPTQPLADLPLPITAVKGLLMLEDGLAAVIDIAQASFQEEQSDDCYTIFMHINQDIIGIGADHIDGIKAIDEATWEPHNQPFLPFINQEEAEVLYLITLG